MKNTARYDFGLLVLRLALGLCVLFYGSQKLLGVFGGAGFQGTLEGFQKGMGIHPVLASLAIFAEFFGGLGLIVGFLTPVAATGVFATMSFATFKVITSEGTLQQMTSSGNPADGHKVLFPIALALMALAILIMGAGKLSVDAKLFGGKGKKGRL